MRPNAILLLASLLFSFNVNATSNQITIPGFDKLKKVDMGNMSAMEVKGRLFMFTENSRYIFDGKIVDTWGQEDITTLDRLAYTQQHIPVQKMGFRPDELNTISYGKGHDVVIVFVDPQCNYCKKFIEDSKQYIGDYTFKFVVVPALGDSSNQMSKSLFCASDKSQSLESFRSGKLNQLPQKATCDTSLYDKTLITAQMVGVDAVPFFIAPDGRFRSGLTQTIWTWLEGSK